ncbi:sensory box [Vibrio sp. JCM 19236]|nr:sensory box [Vibrio sp. JCM 19236]
MITVTNAGQNRLKESQSNELSLKVNSYSESLGYFFNSIKKDVRDISNHKTTFTFFANLASGMSMEYGLGSSLFQLRRNLIFHTKPDVREQTGPYFDRLLLVGFNSDVIADSHPRLPFDTATIPFAQFEQSEQKIDAVFKGDQLVIRVMHSVRFNGEIVGVIVGYVNNEVLTRLLTSQENVDRGSRLDLTTDDGIYPIWNSLGTDASESSSNISFNTLYFDQR